LAGGDLEQGAGPFPQVRFGRGIAHDEQFLALGVGEDQRVRGRHGNAPGTTATRRTRNHEDTAIYLSKTISRLLSG
jgi:hypothetical protein